MPTQTTLSKGIPIHFGDEMSLTELWRASGKSRGYGPTEWKRREGKNFIAEIQNATSQGRCVIRTFVGGPSKFSKGAGGGGTMAHWQIGLAYAQYLSPELHKICNQIVRDFAEAKHEFATSVTTRANKKDVGKIATRDCAGNPAGTLPSALLNITSTTMPTLLAEEVGATHRRCSSHRVIQTCVLFKLTVYNLQMLL